MDQEKLIKDAAWLLANPGKDLAAEYHDAGSCWQLINVLRLLLLEMSGFERIEKKLF